MFSKWRGTKSLFFGKLALCDWVFLPYWSSWSVGVPHLHTGIYHLPTMHWLSHLHAFAVTVQLGSITLTMTLICFYPLSLKIVTPNTTTPTTTTTYTTVIFSPLPPSCPCVFCRAISPPEYHHLGSRQKDFGWVTQYIGPLCLLLFLSLCLCSSITSPSLKGQRREWHLSARTLFLLLFLPASSCLPHLRQSDIYRGIVCLLGSSCSFWR